MYTTGLSLSIKEKEDRKNSFYLSVAIHLIILLLLLMIPLKKALEANPEMQGIMVDFGNPNAGQENLLNEPILAETSQEIAEAPKETPAEEAAPAPVEKSEVTPVQEAPALKVEAPIVENSSPIVASKEVVLEKQTKVVASSTSNTSNEVKKAEKTEAQKQVEKQAESKAKFGSLFGGGASDSENDKKGDEFGIPDASVLEGLSKGTGEAGDGLDSRGLVYEPTIEDNSQKSGKVVVKVCVNNQGNVTSSKYTQRGSSTTDSYLIALAESSAKKYKFTPSNAAEQCGTITIDFIVK